MYKRKSDIDARSNVEKEFFVARWVQEVSRRQNIKNPEYLNKENEAITKHHMQTQESEIKGVRIAHPMRELTPRYHQDQGTAD